MKRRAFILALPLASCATRRSTSDGLSLNSGQGLLALKLMSNAVGSISFAPYAAESSVGSRLAESVLGPKGVISIAELEQYFIIPVDAGEYMWSRFSAFSRFADLRTSNRFEVIANTITYVGHIRTFVNYTKLSIDVFDRTVDMRDHLREHFPRYYETLRFQSSLAQFRLKAA